MAGEKQKYHVILMMVSMILSFEGDPADTHRCLRITNSAVNNSATTTPSCSARIKRKDGASQRKICNNQDAANTVVQNTYALNSNDLYTGRPRPFQPSALGLGFLQLHLRPLLLQLDQTGQQQPV